LQAQCQIEKIAGKIYFSMYFINLVLQVGAALTAVDLSFRYIRSCDEFNWCKLAPMHSKTDFLIFV
jgi:hypothetical protein